MTERIFTLKDNRKLSYAVYGPANGKPVLYHHGTPSSRREILLLKTYGIDVDALLHESGLQLIAVDRHAFTTFHRNRTFYSFAGDVAQLLVHLGIRRCPVLCWSGGGPYALAMAHRFSKAIEGVYILCGFTRRFDKEVMQQMGANKWYFRAARFVAPLLYASLEITRRRTIRSLPPRAITGLPYRDYSLLQKGIGAVANFTLKEATRNGSRSAVHEAVSYYRHFGFCVRDLSQPIHYWWGTKDMSVVEAHARWIEQQAPKSFVHYREGEGHLSLYLKSFGEALQTIARAHARRTTVDS